MEWMIPGFIRLFAVPIRLIRFYSDRPKLHINVDIDRSITDKLRFVTRISLKANYFNLESLSTNDKGELFTTIRNIGNRAILIDKVGIEIKQLSRSSLRMTTPKAVMHCHYCPVISRVTVTV